MTALRSGIALSLAVVLAGCAAPRIAGPVAEPVAPAWSAGIGTQTADDGVLSARWWEGLNDPVLNALVVRAERNNGGLRIAAARLAQAAALSDLAAAGAMPWVNGGMSVERQRVPETRLPGGSETIPPYRRTIHDARIVLGYEIDLFKRLALAQEAAEADRAASEFDRQAVLLRMRYEVVAAYADLRLADTLTASLRRETELRRSQLAHGAYREAAGLDPAQRKRHLGEQLLDAERRFADLASRRHASLARLALLTGQAPADMDLSADPAYFETARATGNLPADLPAEVVARRPDVAAAWQAALAAGIDAERVGRERFPALTITGAGGYLAESFSRWLRGDALTWLVGLALQGPLWDGGRTAARSHVAAAAAQAAEAAYRQRVHLALSEVESALASVQAQQRQGRLDERLLEQRKAAVSDAARAMAAGRLAAPERLEAEIERLSTEQQAESGRHGLLIAWAGALLSLGR